MPGNTDKRIIQMQFENKQFEKNIAKSTKSVEDLKQAMNFEETSKGLKKFADSTKNLTLAGFEKLSDNIQKLTDKFTGLGTLSELVLSQIRRGIESVARDISNFINSITTVQVSAGMDKYNTLNKSVQTIKAATGESEETVYKVLERLSDYTDQTSYNFADMAQNIGKFTSVGIDLESAERQMEGIANWAARSGAGINEASRAMYNLSQAMGVGKLTKIDWKSIENAGMATKEFKEQLIQAGVALGTLTEKNGKFYTKKGNTEVNYKNVADTLAKGWASSEVLSTTLEKYYYDDLFYENENQEALIKLSETQQKEFDKMIASGNKLEASEWKALVNMGVISNDTREKLVNLAISQKKLTKETKEDGKVVYKTVNKTGKTVEFTLDEIEKSLGSGWFDKGIADAATSINSLAKDSYEAAQKCLTFTDVLGAWRDQVSSGWMKSFTLIFGELSEAMKFFSDICNRVGEGLGSIIELRNDILTIWNEGGGRQTLLDLIIGNYGDNTTKGAYGFLDILSDAGKLISDGFADFFYLFMNPVDRLKMQEDPEYFKTWLAGTLLHVGDEVQKFLKNIKKFFNTEINVNGKTKTRLEVIHDIVDGIAGAIKFAYDIVTKAIDFIGKIGTDLSPGLDSLLGFFGDLGRSIFDTADEMGKENKIQKFFNGLREDVKPVTDSLNDLMTSVSDLLRIIFGLDKEGATQTDNIHAIGEAIRTVARIISKVLGPIIKFISRVVDAFGKLFKDGVNADSIKQFGADLGDAFGEMAKTFADSLPDSMKSVKDWVNSLFGGGEEAANEKSDSLFSLIKGKKKEADKITKDAQKSESKGPGILGLMTGSNIAVWLGVASLASVVLLLRKARKVVGSVGDFFGNLSDTLKNGFKVKFQDESFATKFIKIAAAITLVAASIYVLGTMPLSALVQGGIAVAVVFGVMFGMFKLLQKSAAKGAFKDQLAFAAQVTALAFAMMALSVAVGIMALALIPFTLMSWEQYGKAMAGLGGILLELAAFMAIVKVLKIGNIKLAGFAAFAIGIGLIVQGITPFAYMSWDQYGRAMAGLGGVLLQLIAFMGLMRLMDIGTKGIKLAGIVAFSFAIVLLVQAIKPFANMTWDQYARVMAGLGGVLLELIAFMGLMRLLDIGTKGIKLSGVVSFALAIVLLVQAILPFKDMTWDQYARVMAGLGGVLLEIMAFMGLMRLMDIGTKGIKLSGIISFALAIVILIQAILPFKDMTWDQYAKVMAGLGGVLLEILAFMGLMRLMDIGTKGIKLSGFILFVIGLKLLIDSIMPFTTMTWDQYAKSMAGLGGMLLELLVFMGIMKLIGSRSLDIAAFMPFAYGIQALVNAIIPFASMSWEEYAKTMAGLAGVLAIMLGFMAMLKLVKPSIKNMLQMAIFAGIFAAVAGVFAVILSMVKDMDWKVIAAFSVGLGVLVAAFAAAAAIASLVGIKGFVILAAGLVLLLGVIALMAPILAGGLSSALNTMAGSLNYLTSMFASFNETMNSMDEGSVDKSENMLMRLKDLFANLSDFGGYSAGLSAFSTALWDLGTTLQLFALHTEGLTNVEDNGALKLIKELSSCSSDLDRLSKLRIKDLTSKISGLGGAMMLYAQGAKEATGLEIGETPDVTAAVGLMKSISESLANDSDFKIPTDLPDADTIGNFGAQLAALAAAMVRFEEAGRDMGTGTENAKRTLTFFKELKKDLDQEFSDNLYEAITIFGTEEGAILPNQLETFGKNIEQLGIALNTFAQKTTEVDKTTGEVKPVNYDKAIEALTSFSDLENRLPTIGGIKSWWDGNHQTLVDLGGQIQTLGDNLNAFSQKIIGNAEHPGFDPDSATVAIKSAGDMITFMEQMKEKLPKVGGIVGFFSTLGTGRNFDFTDLETQMGHLANGLGALGTKLNDGSWKDTAGVKNAFETMDSVFALMTRIQSFYKQMDDAGIENWTSESAFTKLSEFVRRFADDDNNVISNLSEFMRFLDVEISTWEGYDEGDFDKVITRMEAFRDFAEGFAHLTSMIDDDRKAGTSWGFLGTKLTTEIAQAITDGLNDVILAVQNMVKSMYAAADPVEGVAWNQIGVNVVTGIAKGIDDEGPVTLWPSVQSMMQRAYEKGKEAIDSNSPSKLFMQLGAFMGEGTAIGIRKSTEEVSATASEMGEVALDSATNMIGLISRIMAEGADTTPTISPILDMTNIDAGMAAFRDSLNGYGINLDTAYSAGRAARIGTNTYEDPDALKPDYSGIYSEMRILGNRIEQMGREIRSMKLVLDTGAVAGGVADILDEEYGRREFYTSREG